MKTRYALTAYYYSVAVLVALTVVIIIKLVFWPACVSGSSCAVDGWSVAGLAATILGVSAAVLAILGSIAVAGWWTVLDQRVTNQVSLLFDKQKVTLNERVDKLVEEQERKLLAFQTQSDEYRKRMTDLNQEVESLRSFTDTIVQLALQIAMVNPPWEIDSWASSTMDKFKIPDIARQMALNYLTYLDSLLSPNSTHLTRSSRLAQQNAPTNPLYYWERVLRWQKIADDYDPDSANGNPFLTTSSLRIAEVQKELKEKIESCRVKVEAWKRQQER